MRRFKIINDGYSEHYRAYRHYGKQMHCLCWCILPASLIAQLVKNLPAMQETLLHSWVGKIRWRRDRLTHSSILGFPWWLSWWRIRLQCRRPGFDPWVGKIPWRRQRLPTPVFSISEEFKCISCGSNTFPCGSAGKESTCSEGYLGSIPGVERSPGEGKGYPLQYPGLGEVHELHSPLGHKESDTTFSSLHFSSCRYCSLSNGSQAVVRIYEGH